MPKQYGKEFRRAICARPVAGERVSKVSEESGVSPATLHLWKRQALIDAGTSEPLVKPRNSDPKTQGVQ